MLTKKLHQLFLTTNELCAVVQLLPLISLLLLHIKLCHFDNGHSLCKMRSPVLHFKLSDSELLFQTDCCWHDIAEFWLRAPQRLMWMPLLPLPSNQHPPTWGRHTWSLSNDQWSRYRTKKLLNIYCISRLFGLADTPFVLPSFSPAMFAMDLLICTARQGNLDEMCSVVRYRWLWHS